MASVKISSTTRQRSVDMIDRQRCGTARRGRTPSPYAPCEPRCQAPPRSLRPTARRRTASRPLAPCADPRAPATAAPRPPRARPHPVPRQEHRRRRATREWRPGPPRRSARRRRAMSTRTRRIICADTPKNCPRFCQRDGLPPEQAHAHLVDQRRGLKADVRALARQVARRHAMELVVDEGQHAVERVRVPLAPGAEQAP